MKNKVKDIYMYTLAAIVMLLLFTSLILIFIKAIPQENKDLAYMGFGLSLGWGTMVISYFFGSSKGSAEKNDIINQRRDPSGL